MSESAFKEKLKSLSCRFLTTDTQLLIESFSWRTGKPLEWLLFLELVAQLENYGYSCKISDSVSGGDFLFNNQIPRTYKAISGRDSMSNSENSITKKFIASLTPKAIVNGSNISISIFKEGNPIQELINNESIHIRPDIVLTDIVPADGFPKVDDKGNVQFMYINKTGSISGSLQPVLGTYFPLVEFHKTNGFRQNIYMVIESTVNKSKLRALEQIDEYSKILETSSSRIFVLTPKKIKDFNHSNEIVISPENLKEQLSAILKKVTSNS